MRLSTQRLKPEASQSLFSNVQTASAHPVPLTIKLLREASALPVYLTMKFSMNNVRLYVETELRTGLKSVMTGTLSVGMAVLPPAPKNLTIFAQDSPATALFSLSVGMASKKRLLKNVMIMT